MVTTTCLECKAPLTGPSIRCPACNCVLSVVPVSGQRHVLPLLGVAAVVLYLIGLPLFLFVVALVLRLLEGNGANATWQTLLWLFRADHILVTLLLALPLALLLTTPICLFADRIQRLNLMLTIGLNTLLLSLLLYRGIAVSAELLNIVVLKPVAAWLTPVWWAWKSVRSWQSFESTRDMDDPNDSVGKLIMSSNIRLWMFSLYVLGIAATTDIILARHGAYTETSARALFIAIACFLTSIVLFGFLRYVSKERWDIVSTRLHARGVEKRALYQASYREMFQNARAGKFP